LSHQAGISQSFQRDGTQSATAAIVSAEDRFDPLETFGRVLRQIFRRFMRGEAILYDAICNAANAAASVQERGFTSKSLEMMGFSRLKPGWHKAS
jgi:hypothetical protein